MKAFNIVLLSLIFNNVLSQDIVEKEVKTEVNEVTVFLDGAQIVRKTGVDLKTGETIVKFINLSPFIDAKRRFNCFICKSSAKLYGQNGKAS